MTDQLLADISNYKTQIPEEQLIKTQFLDFVKSNSDCFERSLLKGHVTASAFVVDIELSKVLLMNHKKLNKWLQPGGHCDGDSDTLKVALKETQEEMGIIVKDYKTEIFDIDIHTIPENKSVPEHLHYDVRYLFHFDSSKSILANSESNDVKWIDFAEIETYTSETSILRMLEKLK